MGGPVTGGTPYIVGENGPELFVPGASGTIVPNDVLAASASRAGGGGGNTYAINVQAGVGDPRQIGQQVVEYIKRFEASNSASWRAA
jgi:phage-related minor tail protein